MKKERIRSKLWLLLAAAVIFTGFGKTKTTPAPLPDEVHILISLGGDSGYQAFYEGLINRFNQAAKDVRLVPYYAESDSHAILKLLYSKQANLTYDIACLGAPQITTLTDMDLIRPLDRYVLRDLGIGWLNLTPPGRMANAMKHGEIYSLPFFYTNTVLYCNEDMIPWKQERITTAGMLRLASDYYAGSGLPGLLLAADQLMLNLLAAGEPGAVVTAGEREKTLTVTGETRQQLLEQTRQLLREGSGINRKANGVRNFEEFIEGRVPLLAGSSFYAGPIQAAAEFTVGTVKLTIDEETDYPMNGYNLYLVNQSDCGEPAWTAILRLIELADEWLPEGAPSNNVNNMAVHQNSKIRRMMEMAILRMWREETATAEIINQLQAQVDEVLQEGE